MTEFNQELDRTLRAIFWWAWDLGIIAGLVVALIVYILWVVIERQDFTPRHRLTAYLLGVALLGDSAAILWTWGIGWQWTMTAGLVPPLVVMLYFMPTAVAIYWQHPSLNSIFAINLLTGWTLVGWALALMWAYRSPMRSMSVNLEARLRPSAELVTSLNAPLETSREQIEAVRSMLRRRS